MQPIGGQHREQFISERNYEITFVILWRRFTYFPCKVLFVVKYTFSGKYSIQKRKRCTHSYLPIWSGVYSENTASKTHCVLHKAKLRSWEWNAIIH